MNTKSDRQALQFLIGILGISLVLLFIYFTWRSGLASGIASSKENTAIPPNSEAHAAWIIGLLSVAAGVAGAWVAIKIASTANAAQELAVKFEDPYFQQAIALHKAARHVTTSLEFLMAGLETTRSSSYTQRSANLGALRSACNSHSSVLQEYLISSGLFGYMYEVEQGREQPHRLPSIVQDFFRVLEELAKPDAASSTEEDLMRSFVVSMAGMQIAIEIIEKMPDVDQLAEQLRTGRLILSGNSRNSVTASPRLHAEIKRSCHDYLNSLKAQLKLGMLAESRAIEKMRETVLLGLWKRALDQSKDDQNKFDWKNQNKFDWKNLTSRIENVYKNKYPKSRLTEKDLPLGRMTLIDTGFHIANDLPRKATEFLSDAIGPVIQIRRLADFVDCIPVANTAAREMAGHFVESILHFGKSQQDEQQKRKEKRDTTKELCNLLDNVERHVYLIRIGESENDFYPLLYMSSLLPWSVVVWVGYPYLPNPGIGVEKWLKDGYVSTITEAPPHISLGDFSSKAPVFVVGSLDLHSERGLKTDINKNAGIVEAINRVNLYVVIPDEVMLQTSRTAW